MTPYLPREAARSVARALRSMPVVVLTGMRQTGKTTLLQEEPGFKNRRYITLDNFAQLEAARQNPEILLQGDEPLTIDEVQKCPSLLGAIKREVDRRRKPGRFLLSGSANLALLAGVSETLAGRAIYLSLQPFSRRERRRTVHEPAFLENFLRRPELAAGRTTHPITMEEVLKGGMPPVCLGEAEKSASWFLGFEQSYLERDLRSLAQVADLVAFRRLLQLAALRTGQLLNQADLGRDAHLNAVTTGRYLGLLETSFVVARLPAFRANRTSRLVKSPKLYVSDSGLAAHLAGVSDLDPSAGEPLRGALFETYMAQYLGAILAAHRPEARMYHWQSHGRHEVDFVIETGRKCIAVEVKAATRWNERDLRGLEAFLSATPGCQAAILAHNGTQAACLKDRLWALPAALLIG